MERNLLRTSFALLLTLLLVAQAADAALFRSEHLVTTQNETATFPNSTYLSADFNLSGGQVHIAPLSAGLIPQLSAGKINLTNGHMLIGNGSNVAADVAMSGDGSISTTGALTVLKTNGVNFAASATADTTNASNIGSGSLALGRIAAIANNTALGNVSGGSAAPVALTSTQLTTIPNVFSSSLQGMVPPSGGGTTNYLRADGTFASPGGGVNSVTAADGTLTITPTTGAVTAKIPSSVALPGSPTTTTQAAGDATTKLATTAFVTTATGSYLPLTGGTVTGNLNADCTGSSTGSPRVIGMSNLNAGNAASFRFGDAANAISNSNGGNMFLNSYWGLHLYGHTELNIPSFTGNSGTEPCVTVFGQAFGLPTLVVTQGASQTGDAFQIRNSSGTVLTSIDTGGTTVTSTGTEIVIQETGDTYGTVKLHLQNRNGSNGALFENTTIPLVDFGFNAEGTQRNIRFESRAVSSLIASPEFQLGTASNPTLTVSDQAVLIRSRGGATPFRITNGSGDIYGPNNYGSNLFTLDSSGNGVFAGTVQAGSAISGAGAFAGSLSYSSSAGTALCLQNTAANGYVGFDLFNDSNTRAGSFQYGNSGVGGLADTLFIGPRTSGGKLAFTTGPGVTTRLTLLPSGNIGIGDTNPANPLSVTGNASVTGTLTVSSLTLTGGGLTNANLANMANNTVKGNVSGGTTTPSDLTATQLTTIPNVFSSSLQGMVPPSGGGTVNFLRADNAWAPPPGGGVNVDINCQTPITSGTATVAIPSQASIPSGITQIYPAFDALTPGTAVEYTVPTGSAVPLGICSGPNSSTIWFTEAVTNKVGKFDPVAETFTEYTIPTGSASSEAICVAPDGRLFFGEAGQHKIGSVTISGTFTEYATTGNVTGVCAGPDGNIWATLSNDKIAKCTTGGTVTEYSAGISASCGMEFICAGPDGKVYFTEGAGNRIGSITMTGTVVEHTVPTGNCIPQGICVGSDGRIWFTEFNASKIGAMDTAGNFSEYAVASSTPEFIAPGPRGELWFTDGGNYKISSITTSGTVTPYTYPSGASNIPYGVCINNKNVWFTIGGANKIAKLPMAAGNGYVAGAVFSNATITTVPGSVSGNLYWSMPERGTGHKKVVIEMSAFHDAGVTITFPTAFTYTPSIGANGTGLTISAPTTTQVVIPASTSATGAVTIEGF